MAVAAEEPGTGTSIAQEQNTRFRSLGTRPGLLCLILVAATLIVYNRVSQNSLTNLDDRGYIVNNPAVRAGLQWNTVVWAFTTTRQANWHPLTWLSHALDFQLFGLNPAGHHYVNLLLHAFNVVLVFLVLRAATGYQWRSMMVAALFALHPINVESVAWASERKNVLSMLFFLLALGAYGWYARKVGWRRYSVVSVFFALGLMAKPQVITLPFVLLLWDYWPLRRMELPESFPSEIAPAKHGFWFLLAEKLPLLCFSLASAIITMKAQSTGGAVRADLEFSVRLKNAIVSYARYIEKAVWPFNLSPIYQHPSHSLAWWQVFASALLIALITVLVLAAKQQRYLAFGWFWFLGTLVPMIGLVQMGGQAMADRYAYLPFLGLFIMAVWGAAGWAEKRQLSCSVLTVPSVAVLIGFSALTYHQISYWHDSVRLWSRALQIENRNYMAEDNLADALQVEGRIDEAAIHFRNAEQINPRDGIAPLNIGIYERQHGHPQQAIEQYQKALQASADPGVRMSAYSNLGNVYCDLRDYVRAKESYEAALRIAPDNPYARLGLGLLAERAGDPRQAAGNYSVLLTVQPSDVGYLLLARALQHSGRGAEAQAARSQAERLSPNFSQAEQTAASLSLR
jgi:protein O-mannosyl-transferase